MTVATSYPEFIPGAGASLATKNVLSGAGRVRWMVRKPSRQPADNGWRIMSDVDSSEYLSDSGNWVITDFNELCAIEPALLGIYDFPVGSDFQLVDDGSGIQIFDTASGREIPRSAFYVPPAPEPAEWRPEVVDPEALSSDQRELAATAAALFEQLARDAGQADSGRLNVVLLPDDLGVAVVRAVRGGGVIFVARDSSVLYVTSAIDLQVGLDLFRDGQRTPLSSFE
ncbi:DUF2185 domain-containing protein [Agromyces cerinus subsp. nitratus]|uniref:DUF2185 domain-containing protein n=1 Tax=Agromyces cerinus TaxID=33878 RepID=UPI001956F39D|nr:DUF2185 domain-containing protein [Agromyces cerinus]